jgi:peptidoglycan hydrolase-like protein with peptidoglycan-binding domain
MADQQLAYPTPSQDSATAEPQGPDLYEQPYGNAAVVPGSFLQVVETTQMFRHSNGQLESLRKWIHPPDVLREATGEPPPDGPYTFVATLTEVFGWVEDDALEPTAAPPSTSAVSMPTQPAETSLPELSPEEYDHLALMAQDTPLYFTTRDDVEPMATCRSMEAYVVLATDLVDGWTWTRVKLVRDPPVIGWMKGVGRAVDNVPEVAEASDADLQRGMTAPEVLELEQRLDELGYPVGVVDEKFDRRTSWAVKRFQRDHGLVIDGQVGPQTRAALRQLEPGTQPGTWMAGYRMRSPSNFRAATPSGLAPSDGGAATTTVVPVTSVSDVDVIDGEVDVLFVGGEPATTQDGDKLMWYVRRIDGVSAGWVAASWVEIAPGSTREGSSVREEIAASCPNGITVSFVTQHVDPERHYTTFLAEAGPFAANANAVALSGGQLVTGTSNVVGHKDDIVAILAQIQELLRGDEPTVPRWARVAHIGIFTHGSDADNAGRDIGGLNTSKHSWADDGNLRMDDLPGLAGTLALFGTPDMRMSFFACSTGAEFDEWKSAGQPEHALTTAGEGSFADNTSDELVAAGLEGASVMGHITVGPTVRNPNARLYIGGEDYAVNPFNWALLPLEPWLGEELAAAKGVLRDPQKYFRDELWRWYYRRFLNESEFALLVSTDPEAFRVVAQRDAKAWVIDQMPAWGVFVGGYQLGSDVEIQAAYPRDQYRYQMIPPRAALTPVGPTETWTGDWGLMIPVEWVEEDGQAKRGWIKKSLLVPLPDPAT